MRSPRRLRPARVLLWLALAAVPATALAATSAASGWCTDGCPCCPG